MQILKRILTLGLLCNILIFVNQSLAQTEVAKLDVVEGEVTTLRSGAKDFQPIEQGASLFENDVVKTGKHGRAGLLFSDGFLLRLAENTTLQIQPQSKAGEGRPIKMDEGQGYFFSREPKEFPVIASPAVTTAVRGTEFTVSVSAKETLVSVLDGRVECSNDKGSVQLAKGEQALTKLGYAPVKSILVNPHDAVQWAIQYPVVADKEELSSQFSQSSQDAKEKAAFTRMSELANDGKRGEAITYFETLKNPSNPALITYAAQLYLSNGEIEKSRQLLIDVSKPGKTLSSDLRATVYSMQSIIALAQDDKERSRSLASEALSSKSDSPAALLANAYVAQSSFDLEKSKALLAKLSEVRPNNAFSYAKKAELELGFGHIDQAEELLQKARELSPRDPYVLTIYGFLNLIKNEREDALKIFSDVIAIDGNSALAHLGRGLALVKGNDLIAGREEISRAVYLDPMVALYRSYLGKAYFEEERENLADHEYERAMSLDPRDPTPYLYRAYSKLSQNEPVKALDDVESSIALNNNRAVYRSRLLMDQDLGVRSAGLSEVFTSLGFTEAARVEAIKSLSRDYTNFSAHRLLAESNNTIVLNDARLSERKLAELLSPLSFNLFNRPSSDSADASLNDYSTLFDRNANRADISNEWSSSDDTLSPGATFAGKTDKFGYAAGYQGLFTGGSKDNNYTRRNIGNVALQYQPTYEDRILLTGDGVYRRKYDDQEQVNGTEFDEYNASLGYTHRFGPQSKFIAEATYSDQKNDFLSNEAERIIDFSEHAGELGAEGNLDLLINEFSRETIKSYRGTLQYLYDSENVAFVFGSQYYNAHPDRDENSLVLGDDAGVFTDIDYYLRSHGGNVASSYDFYNYTTLHLTNWMDLVGGANFTELEKEEREFTPFIDGTQHRAKLAPKFGALFYPTDTTTIRSAYFETIRKSSLEDVTSLEPTIVGGINQRFTDFSGAEARNVGVGIDQKIGSTTYFGVEGLYRHILDRSTDATSSVDLDFDTLTSTQTTNLGSDFENHVENDVIKTYLYQVLSSRWVTTLDYEWNDYDLDGVDQEYQLHKVGGSLRYFDPSGFFVFGTATWREQDLVGNEIYANGASNFWIADAGIGYRIPKRHGAVLLKVNNIFDEDFTYDQSQGFEEFVRPETTVSLLFSVNFEVFN